MSEFDYSVRADGKRTAVVEQVYDGTATKTTEVDWLYDDIGRLVAEVYDADTSVDGDSQFVDAAGAVINSGTAQVFAYDAYGNPHGFSLADALTTHLYSGEQTDQLTGLQYLRARYYNPATGTFNRLDPFAGNTEDPQSLHKYLYCHADPVNGVDPSGLYRRDPEDKRAPLGTDVHTYLGSLFKAFSIPGVRPRWGGQWVSTIQDKLNPPKGPGRYGGIPDLVEAAPWFEVGQYYEIKPGSLIGLIARPLFWKDAARASSQLRLYGVTLRRFIPEYTWCLGRTFLSGIVPHPGFWSPWMPAGSILVTFNDYIWHPGVLLYDFVDYREAAVPALLPQVVGASAAARSIGLANQGINALRVNYMFVQSQLGRAVNLAAQGKAFDRERLRLHTLV